MEGLHSATFASKSDENRLWLRRCGLARVPDRIWHRVWVQTSLRMLLFALRHIKTMPEKQNRIAAEDIQQLVENKGGCIATDTITVDGLPVGYMYREPPCNDVDTGWRFMAGDESEEYMDCADHHSVYAVNTIANYDQDIVPFVDAPIGSAFARNPDTGEFEPVESPVDPDDCLHPDFPVVTGNYRLAPIWSVSLPLKFNRRNEDGSIILWRPGITLYVDAWSNDHDESMDIRLAELKLDISPDAFEAREEKNRGIQRFSYRLVEDGVHALYGFVVVNSGHLQVAVYFDNPSDVELVRSIFASIAENTG